MSKMYGNVINRLEEGRTLEPIAVDTDITMYHWSDRTCYYVTKVFDDKHIAVKRYRVIADHDKEGGMGHQDWLYFKTNKEAEEYLRKYFPDNGHYVYEPPEEEWVFRRGKWMRCYTLTEENDCTDRERKSLEKNGYYKRYFNLSGKVSFGVRDYYYDWSF